MSELFDKFKYAHLNQARLRELEIFKKVGRLDQIVQFAEDIGCIEMLYFFNPEDMWHCFNQIHREQAKRLYKKYMVTLPKVDKKDFKSQLIRLMKDRKNPLIKYFVADKRDAYEVARFIANTEDGHPKTSNVLSKCGNLNPILLRDSIEILRKAAKQFNLTDYKRAAQYAVKNRMLGDMKWNTFSFYSRLFIGIEKITPELDEALLDETKSADEIAILTNRIAQASLFGLLVSNVKKYNLTSEEKQYFKETLARKKVAIENFETAFDPLSSTDN